MINRTFLIWDPESKKMYAGYQSCIQCSIADPGSDAFLPPGSGIRIRDELFPDPGSKGYVFGEIFLRILVL
jgi:hypothetical protein